MSNENKSSIDIKLKRADRVYKPGDAVEGVIIVNAYKGWSHTGIQMLAEGVVHMSSSSRGIMGLGTDFTGKQIHIMKVEQEICSAGKFADGITEIPFEFPIRPNLAQPLVESYHGVYISVIYYIQVLCERGMMKKSLSKDIEFIVEIPTPSNKIKPETTLTIFNITPDSLENISKAVLATIPQFKITGKLHKNNYSINSPFTGEVVIGYASAPIKSVELQLVRIESVLSDDKFSREATEVQNIQIGDGNVVRDLVVPMYMVFPRLFSCATVISTQFKVEFEVNLIVIFADGYVITENFPITLTREA